MDKSWLKIVHRTKDNRYKLGVEEFLKFAYHNKEESSKIPCPCRSCNNFRNHDKSTVFLHLMHKGIAVNYDKWIYHGESYEDISDDNLTVHEDDSDSDDGCNDNLDDMLNNIGESNWGENWRTSGGCQSSPDIDVDKLRRLFDEAHEDLYPGCPNFSKFSFIVSLLHLKTTSGWTIKSFDCLLDIFNKSLPSSASIPKNFYEAKKYIRDLGFKAQKIHACINDCVLFRGEYASHTHCPNDKCNEPRFKGKDSNVPQKILRYFPLKSRLQRLFMNEEVAQDMRWHKEKRVDDGNIIRHPSDSESWKHIDRIYPEFAHDPRSVRLGLATDGFNPFGNLSNAYSIWPVFLVPYNLPPWKCMKDPFIYMSMLIPGPKSPGINIDVYLQPLIDELNELWVGVDSYDAFSRQKFTLRAALLWTINDFPAYGMLSGWSIKGYHACPVCMNETSSYYLQNSRKMCYMGHRRFLPSSHPWRKDKKSFDGTVELRDPLVPKSGHEILHELECLGSEPFSFGNCYNQDQRRKRKRHQNKADWKKKSVFFKLPYWADLKLRHNIDIMHVVKNVTESLLGTVFDIKGKTKDTWKSRKDLMDQGLKKDLHLQPHGNSFIMPMACYHVTKDEKNKIIPMLKSLKFPDSLASNLSRCIKGGEFQLSGMKSHDLYVFIQRVMPLSIRGCLTKEVRLVLYELSDFIQKVCSRSTYLDVLEAEEMKVALILCKLERIFPPSLFDIMTHLLIHLPHEAKIAGPPQYRWMFPFERKMGTLKGYVHNKAQPEGCIAERYIDKECLTFCSMYLNNVETIFNRVERNNEMKTSCGEISIFSCRGRPIGSPKPCDLCEVELANIHSYILNNCEEIEDMICEHKLKLEEENYDNIDERHNKQFSLWFRERVLSDPGSYTSEIRMLSRGPLNQVNRYTGCVVNGYRFHTQSREHDRKTQNSGVVVQGEHGNNMIDFYGALKDVIEVEYLGGNKRVLVFMCDWFRISDATGLQIDKESGLTSINISRKWYLDQPYVLASQVRQVFYVPDIKLGGNWCVVQSFAPRSLYDVVETNNDSSVQEVYQEQEPSFNLVVDLTVDAPSLSRSNGALSLVDASIVGADSTTRLSSNFHGMEDSFIDDCNTDSSHSESLERDEELWQDDFTDSE